jgi:putative membrane protein
VSEQPDSADRRTKLAAERTYLAWWRTGLTAFAVALATARVVPELSRSKVQWPYTIIGVGFALLGCGCLVYAQERSRRGEARDADPKVTLALTLGGIVLGLALVVLLAIEP